MVHAVKPAYFFGLACDLHPVALIRTNVPSEVRSEILYRATEALRGFVAQEECAEFLPRSVEKGKWLLPTLEAWSSGLGRDSDIPALHHRLSHFETVLSEEIDKSRHILVTNPGNLSVDVLLEGASSKYPDYVQGLINTFVSNEIDEAGTCLALDRNTASGFHSLRAVEVVIKAYIIAINGTLPKNRNWGEYIDVLKLAEATPTLIDELKVLKAKRNPLMHPQDVLNRDEARQLFVLCEASLCAVIDDVRLKTLDTLFENALVQLVAVKP